MFRHIAAINTGGIEKLPLSWTWGVFLCPLWRKALSIAMGYDIMFLKAGRFHFVGGACLSYD